MREVLCCSERGNDRVGDHAVGAADVENIFCTAVDKLGDTHLLLQRLREAFEIPALVVYPSLETVHAGKYSALVI